MTLRKNAFSCHRFNHYVYGQRRRQGWNSRDGSSAGTVLLVGAGVGGMLLGPQMELQSMAAHARTNAFWSAYRELGQVDPANRDAAPFVTNPGWQPGDADVQRIEAALVAAKAAKACTADNPTGARPGPARGVPLPGPTLPSSDLLAAHPPATGMPMPSAVATSRPSCRL